MARYQRLNFNKPSDEKTLEKALNKPPDDPLAEDMQEFVLDNIDKNKKDEKKSMKLEKRFWREKGCCSNVSADAEHWNQLRLIMMYRYKKHNSSACFFVPSLTKKYLKHGIPTIIVPTVGDFVVQILYISFYAIAAILQVIKAQIDGSLSTYAQVSLFLGSIFAIIFFSKSNNYVLILPPFMNILYAILLLFGIFNNCNKEFSCVITEL